ncbi:hypothetical protein [Puniceibacterium sp. IMCC21224]|uniref:hypothetical protein n=1 Tax=Puniceibacterium sp. IMCC21224 TaxID=1618204 RepID=UPI00064DED4C|nr:hypothetical protein [Puniceibacterium sp. IMCC21224]
MDRFKAPAPNKARNGKEALIEDIVSHCCCRTDKEKRELAKRIAIWANTTKTDETDLHALLQKHRDPNIRNYGGFVNWAIKITANAKRG